MFKQENSIQELYTHTEYDADLVQTIAFAFNYSAKRMLCFKEQLAGDHASKQEIEKRTKLQSLCATRWAARADAIFTECDLVLASLEARVLATQLHTNRNDDGTWDNLFTKAVVLVKQVGVEPSIPRNAKRHANRPNDSAATPSDFWAQYLIPSQVGELENETLQQICT
ncbi:hypothetical protein MAR_013081 [Mya arenaria]|uniref:Uncharacterized protein n=1 Tax=Mya arenaria TaxID=6604 RepID=A0ABY7G0F7_MYAAR|nr:hypothetical protein MAR_013081 [Mya arenaria]